MDTTHIIPNNMAASELKATGIIKIKRPSQLYFYLWASCVHNCPTESALHLFVSEVTNISPSNFRSARNDFIKKMEDTFQNFSCVINGAISDGYTTKAEAEKSRNSFIAKRASFTIHKLRL